MSYVLLEGKESLIVTQILFGHSSVARYSLDGKMLQSWNLRNLGTGIDFNASDRSAYLSTSDSNEIYKLDLSSKEVSYVLQVHQARKLSALALDGNKNILYVADVGEGAIYACQISNKSCKIFVSGFGAPTALYLDQQASQLYVADGARRAVFTVSTNVPKPVLTNFTSSTMKSPSGVTLIAGVGVFVSDYGASRVYVFSSQGTLISSLP
jgi:sugar lactone lactonase YvrE